MKKKILFFSISILNLKAFPQYGGPKKIDVNFRFENTFINKAEVPVIKKIDERSLLLKELKGESASIPDRNNKVTISDSENGFEITPYSLFNNGILLQPINRLTGLGLPTTFYIKDTANWSFYTDNTERLTIKGNGDIVTNSPLLVNNAIPDGRSAFAVNVIARFDSTIYLKGTGANDADAFFSFDKNVKNIRTDFDDGISPYTATPTEWANGKNIPVFRLRHNNNVSNQLINTSGRRDFMILPYEYGTAIEYNGVVECWVGEWSIHKGLQYSDPEGNGNGWGGVLWVGDDLDGGGVRSTARNNIPLGGNLNYGEISVEKFTGEANGNFRFRLPSNNNEFQFVYGQRGVGNEVAKISATGIHLPKVVNVLNIAEPEKGQIAFDESNNKFLGYNGSKWTAFDEEFKVGSTKFSADGSSLMYTIAHGLSVTPAFFNVVPTSEAAANFSYLTADSSNVYIHYKIPPEPGAENLSWNWLLKP